MSGLIVKDIRNLLRASKQIVVVLVFYIGLSFMLKNNSFAPMMLVFFLTYQIISSFGYDDMVKWERFAMTMPITRKQLVRSKYLLLLILTGVGMAAGAVTGGILEIVRPTEDGGILAMLLTLIAIGGVFLFMFSFQLPFLFKFGTEKARLFLIITFMIPAIFVYGGIALVKKYQIPMPDESTVKLLIGLSPAALVLILFLSYLVSVKVFQKKEL